MKKLFILLLGSLYLTACGPSATSEEHGHEHTEETHAHEEDTHAHENGDHSHAGGEEHHEQESFEVEGQDTIPAAHSHDTGDHGHEH